MRGFPFSSCIPLPWHRIQITVLNLVFTPVFGFVIFTFSTQKRSERIQKNASVFRKDKAQKTVHGIGKSIVFKRQHIHGLWRKGAHIIYQIQLIDIVCASLQDQLIDRFSLPQLADGFFQLEIVVMGKIKIQDGRYPGYSRNPPVASSRSGYWRCIRL